MTYNADKTWENLSSDASYYAKSYIQILTNGNESYNEWQSYRGGRTNLEIATALTRTETEIAELDACYSAMKLIYDYANNQTPSQSDYLYSLRKFS